MPSRKFIGIVVSLLLIAAMLLIFTVPWKTLRNDSRLILLEEAASVDRISLADQYDSTLLVKHGETWFTSDGEEVNQVAVENLLFAAGRLQINSILPAGKEIEKARKVRFYSEGRCMLAYSVFFTDGQFLLGPEGSDRTFLVTLPGYGGLDLDRVYSSATNHFWKHLLIDLVPSEIRHIEVERRGEAAFRFSMDDLGDITCTLPELDSTLSPHLLDDLSIRLLFSYFTSIRFEERVVAHLENLTEGNMEDRWLGRLYIESQDGEKHTLQVYSLPGEGGEENHMFRAVVVYNNEPDPVIINYIYLDVLMRSLSRYFAAGV